MDAFVKDKSSNAWEKVVDRLLASPRYGERWGRHWLDVVRYADSLDARGVGSEGDISEAWRYRDWVVNAFNRDLPYNQFMKYQIAGDLLPVEDGKAEGWRSGAGMAKAEANPKPETQTPKLNDVNVEGTIATGMLAIGNWGNGDADKDKILTDIADDQVDVVSRSMMGLTVACARCHDHKFDPIPTKDYYGLAGIFFSTHILPKLTPKGAGENILRIPLVTKADAGEAGGVSAADGVRREAAGAGAAGADRRQRPEDAAPDRRVCAGRVAVRTPPCRRGSTSRWTLSRRRKACRRGR